MGEHRAVNGIDLAISPGELVVLLGPSGCGKTTTLRMVAGFIQPDSGEIHLNGRLAASPRYMLPPEKRQLGMMFQNYAIWPHKSVFNNVAYGLQIAGEKAEFIRQRVNRMLEIVNLTGYAGRKPADLSGGQQQRVALARTVVIAPKLLLLDEPLSNLDKQLRVQMREELRSLQRKLGLTTIFVTHDQEEAMTTADRMAVLDKGVLQQVGSAAGLYDYPANRFVAGFVGTANVLEGEVLPTGGESLAFKVPGLGTLTLPRSAQPPAPGRAALAFRPHQVQIAVRDDAGDASRVWVEGQIESAEFLGEFSRYRVRVGEVAVVADQAHYAGIAMFPMGMPVRLGIEPTQLRYLDE
ncbi:MAG: ABC transporter ATP-binding protein [Delftia acidovorans]|jgi:iron(III) transport system ATP-binding protein|nr:ABC transporter ATP-binding protein [Delftia acidovorans]